MKKVFVVVLAIMLASCALTREYPEIKSGPSAAKEGPYLIGKGDGLSISVWRNPDLSVSVPVRPDGKISTPLVGDILAAGLTAEQLAANLTEELSNFIRTPQVTVIVVNASSSTYLHRVRVTGAVNGPISVPHQEGMTVMDLVLQAGGLTPLADGNGANLYRVTEEGSEAYPVYLDDILKEGDLRSNYLLSPSDTITVPESAF